MTASMLDRTHALCVIRWKNAKLRASMMHLKLPDKITAMPSSKGRFFVEGLNDKGEYITACCAFSAKAQRLEHILDAA